MVSRARKSELAKQSAEAAAVREAFASRVVKLRGDRTQLSIGKAAGLHQSSYNEIENGKVDPALSTIVRIAAALGVPVSKLFGD